MSTGGSGSGVCFGPRDTDKPFADSERAQKWRLSLASLLFFTVLLSDHLWLCVEARQVAAGRHRDRERRAEPGMEHDVGGTAPSSSPAAPAAGQCFSLLGDAEAACRRLQPGGSAQAELYLPFCNSYTLRELFAGLSRPDTLNCTVDRGDDDDGGAGEGDRRSGEEEDWLRSCRRCVLVYQRYDRQAQDRYREFELVLQKYLQAEEYSVKSGPEDCKYLLLDSRKLKAFLSRANVIDMTENLKLQKIIDEFAAKFCDVYLETRLYIQYDPQINMPQVAS
ncbi:PREDICTED: transmembrane protein FAM155A-like [Thamnophis sirtalis]|uniref:Transmembrane protein FAM155A-like n=1 Tax=Thamnophis sirtalis TaxID=35019 RepID=A0A6I9XPW8_9SAUR|nr:PREDICTED: transmembrane protein FAM155A-like [Thamnophis sirtalis]